MPIRTITTALFALLLLAAGCKKPNAYEPTTATPTPTTPNTPGVPDSLDFSWSPNPVYAQETISFTVMPNTLYNSYTWTILGKQHTGNFITYKFHNEGIHQITIMADNDPNKVVARQIHVLPRLPRYYYDDGLHLVNEVISFHIDHLPNGATVEWDFGDGSGSTQANPTHVYTKEGGYFISLKVNGQVVKQENGDLKLYIDITKDPLYTQNFAGTRTWNFTNTKVTWKTNGKDTVVTQLQEQLTFAYKDPLHVTLTSNSTTLPNKFDYKYNKGKSSGNILAFENDGIIYYDHVADTAYFYRKVVATKTAPHYETTTIGRTP